MVRAQTCFLAAGIGSAAARGFANSAASTKYAAIAIVDSRDAGIHTVIGEVSKHPSNPILVQDQAWEPRLDNGYPNIVHDPSDPLGEWRMWYGDCANGCSTQLLLSANSSDGISWEKPELGIYDLGKVKSEWASIGTRNNVVMQGGGVGIYRDDHEANASRRFKAFGGGGKHVAACFGPTGSESCISGMATSPDGFRWYEPTKVSWPTPQRYDCHNNLFWDEQQGAYLATTRDGFSGDPGRTIGITMSKHGEFAFDTSKAPTLVEQGSQAAQLYSQITFPFYNAYLGIVMVYDATSAAGNVHCRLSWSPDATNWHWVDAGGLQGREFIPLGPIPDAEQCEWKPVTASGHELTDCKAYRAGARPSPAHYVCTGTKSEIADMPLAACRKACTQDATCDTMQWQGEEQYNYSETSDGQCHLFQSCDSAKSYNSKLAPTFCMQTERCARSPSPPPAFDSHVCFAAASPVPVDGEGIRVYYMGGNGPHSGHRDSAMGIATLRADGFAGLRGTGGVATQFVKVTGATMTITADVELGGSVIVGVSGKPGVWSTPISDNVTDAKVELDVSALVGKEVAFNLKLKGATVYTIGFTQSQQEMLV